MLHLPHHLNLPIHRVQLRPNHHAVTARLTNVLLVLPQGQLVEPLDRVLLTRIVRSVHAGQLGAVLLLNNVVRHILA